jgi:hypothetical protein
MRRSTIEERQVSDRRASERGRSRSRLEKNHKTLIFADFTHDWLAHDYMKGYKATAHGFGMFKYDVWINMG